MRPAPSSWRAARGTPADATSNPSVGAGLEKCVYFSYPLRALEQLGFRFRFTPHRRRNGEVYSCDAAVTRFFPAVLPLLDRTLWPQLKHYFFSSCENSLYELSVFLVLAVALFVGRHLYLNHVMHTVRRRMPLVIGGWGTRGKSGTERLKAALLNGLGHGIVSKTTECEAMFLYAPPYRPLRELFLFRPYDKATIWEQHHLACLADRLQTDIFLWECMALNPALVRLLSTGAQSFLYVLAPSPIYSTPMLSFP